MTLSEVGAGIGQYLIFVGGVSPAARPGSLCAVAFAGGGPCCAVHAPRAHAKGPW